MSKAKNILRTRYAQDNSIKIDILTEYNEFKDLAKEKVLKNFLKTKEIDLSPAITNFKVI